MHLSTLAWKSWRENQTYLALSILASLLLTAHVIAYECLHQLHAFVGHFSQMASALAILTAILMAMRTAKAEQADRTLGFSSTLPVSMRTQALVRIVGAILIIAIPIVLSAAILSTATSCGLIDQVLPRTTENYVSLLKRNIAPLETTLHQLWSAAAIQIASGLQLLIILCVASYWLKTQSQIGFLGPVAALASIFIDSPWMLNTTEQFAEATTLGGKAVPYAIACLGSFAPGSQVIHWGYGLEKSSYADQQFLPLWHYSLAVFVVWLSLGVILFIRGYGRQIRVAPVKKSWWQKMGSMFPGVSYSFQFQTSSASLLWLEMRKSIPMALLGLLLAVLLACVDSSEARTLAGRLPHTIWIIGFLWSAIVGTGVFSAELDTHLGNFWRSRPIDLKQWFAIKFVVGMLAVVLVLDGVAIFFGWTLPREEFNIHIYGMGWAYVFCTPITHIFIYTLSVLVTCWTRKPVIGGVVSLIAFSLIGMILNFLPATTQLDPTTIYNNLLSAEGEGKFNLSQHGFPITYGAMYLSILPMAYLAYRFARPLEARSSRLTWLFSS